MTEETAIRISEALENIVGAIRTEVILMVGIAMAFWIIAMFKN